MTPGLVTLVAKESLEPNSAIGFNSSFRGQFPVEPSPRTFPMIRVAVIDDNPMSRKDLVRILRREPDIRVVAEAETGLPGIREVEEQKPDVILLDNHNPFTDGLEGTELIVSRFQDIRVIVLARDSKNTRLLMNSKHTLAASSCQVGACFHLCQDCSAQEILAAIRTDNPLGEDPVSAPPPA